MSYIGNPYEGFEITKVTKKDLPVFSTVMHNSEHLNSQLLASINILQARQPKSHDSNVKCTWRSDWYIHNETEFGFFVQLVKESALFICQYHLLNPNMRLNCINMWAMKYEDGDYAELHDHFPSTLSGIYYVDVEDDCSPLVIEDTEIKPENGLMVFFPSMASHKVEPTTGKRTLISFNLMGAAM